MEYIEIFQEVHLQVVGVPFLAVNGREGKSLKELYVSVALFWKEKRGTPLEPDQALKAFKHFLLSIDNQYVLDGFVPSIIYQNFQLILNQAYGKRYDLEEKKAIRASNFIRHYTPEELEELAQIKRAYKKQKEEASTEPREEIERKNSLGSLVRDRLNNLSPYK